MYDPGYRYGILMRLDAVTVLIFLSQNLFNYINLADADNSGMLRFLTDELQDAEDKGDRGTFISRASSLLYFTDIFDKFGLSATFSPAGMEQTHCKHQVISVGVMHL